MEKKRSRKTGVGPKRAKPSFRTVQVPTHLTRDVEVLIARDLATRKSRKRPAKPDRLQWKMVQARKVLQSFIVHVKPITAWALALNKYLGQDLAPADRKWANAEYEDVDGVLVHFADMIPTLD